MLDDLALRVTPDASGQTPSFAETGLQKMIADKKFLFIAGLHRSGTSLLHRLIAAHPRVSGFRNTGVSQNEGQHLQTVIPPAKAFGGPGRFGFHPEAHMDETHPLATPENAERLFAQWSRYWDLDADLLVEKSPPNIVRTRFLQALFPNTSFVAVIRHPVVVACATEKWRRREGLHRLVEHWVVCHEAFERDRPRLRSSMVVRYEDLVAAPTSVLGLIQEQNGLLPLPPAEEVNQSVSEKYFRRWEEAAQGWWSGRPIRNAAARLEERVQRFGYSLRDPRAPVMPNEGRSLDGPGVAWS